MDKKLFAVYKNVNNSRVGGALRMRPAEYIEDSG